MRFRTHELFLGAFLAVAVFAVGMLFASSYDRGPAAKSQGQQTAQNGDGGKSAAAPRAESGQGHEAAESKSEFWSAKLTDWLLALLTGLLVLFTYRLWKSTDRLWAAGEKQIGVADRSATAAERALTELERPYIYISNVGRLEAAEIEEGSEFDGDAILSVPYSTANYGKIPAIITQVDASLGVFEIPRIPDRVPDNHAFVVSPILVFGEPRDDLRENLVWNSWGNDEVQNIVPNLGEGQSLFFRIIIRYRGPFTAGHETSACWRYNESTGRMIEYGRPEFTYEK
jgi:hypothetical protein